MPAAPEVADTLGWVYFKKGEYSTAIDLLREAATGRPGNAVFHYHLGAAYAKAGQKPQAAQELREALQANAAFPYAGEARKLLEDVGRP